MKAMVLKGMYELLKDDTLLELLEIPVPKTAGRSALILSACFAA